MYECQADACALAQSRRYLATVLLRLEHTRHVRLASRGTKRTPFSFPQVVALQLVRVDELLADELCIVSLRSLVKRVDIRDATKFRFNGGG